MPNRAADPVWKYAHDVVSGREIAGPYVRQACERHLRDLVDGAKRGLVWDRGAAMRALQFFPDVLTLAGGEYEGLPFRLHCSQQFIVGSLFGWKRSDGYRRYRTAYIEIGKGNGKSPLAAGVGLYMLTADGEARAEVYAAAVDKNQASIVFTNAVAMVKNSEHLRGMILVGGGPGRENNLAYVKKSSRFCPITSEHVGGRGKSGFAPHCSLLDEIHEHPSDAMVEMLGPTASKWRRQPLVLMITNAGVYDPESVCFRHHDYAVKVLGGLEDDKFFAYVCALDDKDNWQDPKCWPKTNPLLGVSIREDYLLGQVHTAQGMPSKESWVRRFNFCEWMESASPFIAPEVWKANGSHASDDLLVGAACYGGLDLSGKNDLTALILVFALSNGKKALRCYFWTPRDGLDNRQARDRAPYDLWVQRGHITATPGRTIDYGFAAMQIAALYAKYDIRAIAFDRYRIDDLQRALEDVAGIDCWVMGEDPETSDGLCLVPHGQGYRDMDVAIEAFEDDLLERRVMHGNHPVLSSCVANAKVTTDPAGLRKFDKRKATGRIDGAVAAAMAENMSVYPPPSGGSIYDQRGVISLSVS